MYVQSSRYLMTLRGRWTALLLAVGSATGLGLLAAPSTADAPSAPRLALTEPLTLEVRDQALSQVLSALAQQSRWGFCALDEHPEERYTFCWNERPLQDILDELALVLNRPWVVVNSMICWARPVRLLVSEVLDRPGEKVRIHPETDFWRLERINITDDLAAYIKAMPEDLIVDILRDSRMATPATWPPAARERWQALLRRLGNVTYRPLATGAALPEETSFWCQLLGQRERGAYARQLAEMSWEPSGQQKPTAGYRETISPPASPLRTVVDAVEWLDRESGQEFHTYAPWQSLPLVVAVNRPLPTDDAVRSLALTLGGEMRPVGNLVFLGPTQSEWVKRGNTIAEPGQPRFSAVVYDRRRLLETGFSGAIADYFIEPCEWVIKSQGDVWKLLLLEMSL
jgi:hypothetical protein